MSTEQIDRTDAAPPFAEHLQRVTQDIRAALNDLLASVGADPTRPQDVARQFGLNKNMTWKVAKIVAARSPFEIVPHLPGSSGFEILLGALAKHGAKPEAIERVREATAAFDRMVEVHTGDRATLELVMSSMADQALHGDGLEQSRRLAFQGNSVTWGVQARIQMTLNAIAPNPDDASMVDLMQLAGLVDFRRLRPTARWLVFRKEAWDDSAEGGAPITAERPLDPAIEDPRGMPLLAEFCSDDLPALRVIDEPGQRAFELPEGPVGNTGAVTCVYGIYVDRVGSRYWTGGERAVEIGVNLQTPVEMVQLDLLVHRDLEWMLNPEVRVVSRLDGSSFQPSPGRERNLLPISETVHTLGRGLAALTTPKMPWYAKLARRGFELAGWNGDDFTALRFTMRYPPIPASVMLASEQPDAPAS